MTIKDYCNAIPDFALYYSFAKWKPELFRLIDGTCREDLYQIIAEAILSKDTMRERNNYLKKQMYYFATRILGYHEPAPIRKVRKIYCKASTIKTCDICAKKSDHYHYQSFIPGKSVCRICYNRIRRQDARRNKR